MYADVLGLQFCSVVLECDAGGNDVTTRGVMKTRVTVMGVRPPERRGSRSGKQRVALSHG